MIRLLIKKLLKQNLGQSIVELLIAVALTAILFPALITGLTSSREGKAQEKQRISAYALLKGAEESVRLVRERSWSEIAINGIYHPEASGSSYRLVSNPETISGFSRQTEIADTFRDANGNIAESGTLDPSTKKITTTISWSQPYSSSINSVIYLTRYLNNNTYIETTVADFSRGVTTGVSVINDEGGEVVLGAGGIGSWCNPNLSITAVDLPKQGVANAVSAIEGQVVAGTGENASGVSFARVDIANPPSPTPPSGNINGTFNGYKTNGVFTEQNNAYLATDNNFKEIVIIDLTQQDANGKFPEAGYFNAPGNLDATSVYTSGNIGFATVENILYTFDLTSKSGSRPVLGQVTLGGFGNKVVVNNNYAYVAVESTNQQLQIIEVSPDGINLTVVGSSQLAGSYGRDLFINPTASRAYLATAASASQREMFVVDITSKTGARPTVASYETNGMNPKGIAIVPGNRAIIVGIGSEEYQVINITRERIDPPMPRCGGINIDSGINGLSSVNEADGDNYSYVITGDLNAELKIIAGGPGGQFFTTGTFESGSFDAGTNVAFNRIDYTADIPINTSLSLQVAVSQAVANDCNQAIYTYVGPDGQVGSYFTTAGPIPLTGAGSYINPGRCFRYKAYFATTDIFYTPVLYDVTVNYSP